MRAVRAIRTAHVQASRVPHTTRQINENNLFYFIFLNTITQNSINKLIVLLILNDIMLNN